MATLKEPFALDRSLNTTEVTPRNIADVLAEELSRITGRNASQVEYDNTESGLTADNVQDALDEIVEAIPTVPSVDIQTAVDEFSTYNGGLLSECKVALSPNQDLHGYAEPWVGGTHENIADFVDGYSISLEGEVVEYVGRCATVNPITIEPDTTYYVKRFSDGGQFIYAVYNGSTVVRRVSGVLTGTALNTSGGDKLYVCAYDGLIDVLKPMVTKNTLPTAYSPYSNICPITGHTQVEVDVSDGQTTQEQITVNLGGTYYSGILDIVTGVFVSDTAEVDLGTLSWTKDSSKTFYAFITDSLTGLQDMWCEVLDPYPDNYRLSEYNNYPDNIIARNTTQKNVYVKCTTYEDGTASDFRTAMSGYKLVYELATPTSIQLSPTMVKALVGENHLSAPLEGQEITESEYRELFTWDEVEAYVNAHSGGSAEHEYSTTERVVGKWINGKTLYERVFTGVSIPNNSYTSNVDLGVLADEVIKVTMVGTAVVSSNTIHVDMIYAKVDNGVTTVVHPTSNIGASLPNAKIAIQYTKTTD